MTEGNKILCIFVKIILFYLLIFPSKLSKGDTVAIISTARKIVLEEIQAAIDTHQNWGLTVELGKNLFAQQNQFAGSDEQRATDLQSALDDENVKAILFARGGYGTVRIIDKIDFSQFNKSPKWIIGYSDITILHSHIHRHFQVATLHSPMAFNFKNASAAVIEKIKSSLFEAQQEYIFPTHPFNRKGNAEGILVGGNLSILYSLLGSASDIDTNGKILFLEDLDEYLYHIDRMMLSLKRNGKLQGLAGLVIGGMSDMKDNSIPFGKTAEEIILDTVKEYDYPVCFGFPAGHISPNLPLIFGDTICSEC